MARHEMTRRGFLKTTGGGLAAGTATVLLSAEAHSGAAAAPPVPAREVDVLICGGGPAGVGAAIMAARGGAKVLLAERYGRLGGMAVHALVAPIMGSVTSPLVTEVVKRLGGREVDPARIDLDYADLLREAGAGLLLHAWACEALMEGARVTGARLMTKQGLLDVRAAVTIDATGDGDVAFRAGAPFDQGRPGDGLLQPVSIMYTLGGVDDARRLLCGSEEAARKVRVPEGTWEEAVLAGQKRGELPPSIGVIRTYRSRRAGMVVVNATQINGIDGTRAEDLTRAELEGRRQAFQVLDFLKKHAPGYEQAYILHMPACIGVRETRRFRGVTTLTREDLVAGRKWPDAVVRNAFFPIDIHNPTGGGQAEGTAARVKPYDIPYGCLVPRQTAGLLLAGRCISGSHDAHASYRVQAIALAIGGAAGAAAAICAKNKLAPSQCEAESVRKALMLKEG